VKQCALVRPPEVLCIHLKRFRHDLPLGAGGSGWATAPAKLSTRVNFPLCDLGIYLVLYLVSLPEKASFRGNYLQKKNTH
jgi:hypothetical protein